MKEADIDEDGKISLEDFMEMMKKFTDACEINMKNLSMKNVKSIFG